DDAKKCANLLGCTYLELNISKAVEAFSSILESAFDTNNRNLWFENLQSRTRGTILMALSNKLNALLITTGNKSELATGYATIYGDM
ncbi:NAD+ synthase, partial [Escherichia coli]|nr:NAD+ synthase [Escherichia coli]